MADSPVPASLASQTGDKIRFLFSRNNLTQASTIKAIIGFIAAIGLVTLTPDQQQQASSITMRFIDALMNMLAATHAAYAFVNLLYNERKHTTIIPISTTAPIVVTGGATVETSK